MSRKVRYVATDTTEATVTTEATACDPAAPAPRLDAFRGQPVDAFLAAAGPGASRRAGPSAGTAADGPLKLAALPLVPRHQLTFHADHAQQPAAVQQQELAVFRTGLNWFHSASFSRSGALRARQASSSLHGTCTRQGLR